MWLKNSYFKAISHNHTSAYRDTARCDDSLRRMKELTDISSTDCAVTGAPWGEKGYLSHEQLASLAHHTHLMAFFRSCGSEDT